MTFRLELLKTRSARASTARGQITIDEFQETFDAPLQHWRREGYLAHWLEAADRLIAGAERSAFVTSMNVPEHANFIVWWPAYRRGQVVLVQQQVLFMDRLSGPFSEAHLFDFVPDHLEVDEDGERVSQWDTSIADIGHFADSLRPTQP